MRSRSRSLPALAALFAEGGAEVGLFALPGGAPLFEAGERSERLFLVRAGRLGAIHREAGGPPRLVGVVRPGEPVGEMALLADRPHGASVVALRDSEVLALPRRAFLAAAAQRPDVLLELSRLLIDRAEQGQAADPAAQPSVFGLVGWNAAARPLAEAVAAELRSEGAQVAVLGPDHAARSTGWLSGLESENDFVLYAADEGDAAWASTCARQADRLFLVGAGEASPPAARPPCAVLAQDARKPVDLVLLQQGAPRGTGGWLDRLPGAQVLHLRRGLQSDVARLGRVLSGRAVALVLSGGGARGYAHVGAIRALRQAGVPLDAVGGASMGAIVAASLAMGWCDDEIESRVRRAFVESSPLDDIAIPMLAMTRGLKVKSRLEAHFGGNDIVDLERPFFCCSSDLTGGSLRVHARGDLVFALRASIALPGVLPPMVDGDSVLVDGGVLRNLPTEVMRAGHPGPIVAVDVSIDMGLRPSDLATPMSMWRWFASGEWRKGPPIVSVLLRSATLTAGRELAAARAVADVFIAPELDGVEIRDWKAFDRASAAGHAATVDALCRLGGPVSDLRAATAARPVAA